jgi:hypothetical protein
MTRRCPGRLNLSPLKISEITGIPLKDVEIGEDD